MFSRFIRVAACVSALFLFVPEYHSIVEIDHILFLHSLTDGHWGCLPFFDIVKNAAINIHGQVFVSPYVFHFSWVQT